ncbi:MAG: hypothetical protein AAF556_01590 [Pseudomonadota bacterium]
MSPKISLGAIWGSPWLLVLLAAAAGHAFAMHGLGIYTAMQAGSIYDLGEEVIFAEEFIFRVPLVLGILALFMRELGARALLLATLIAMVMNNINFFDGILHRFLDQNDLYPLVLRRGDPTNAVNSQIPISFTYLFVYLALVVSVLIKARRTISRIFLLLIMTATLGTTTLFHQLLVDGALVIAIDQERMINRQHLTAIVTVPDEATFQRLCSASATTCATGGVNGPPPAAHPALNQAIIQSFERLKSGSIASNTHTEALRVGALDLDLRGMQFALHREGERYRLAVDMGSYNHLPARYKVYFGTLMIFAHMWWVYGGLALLSFHRSRFAWRFAKQLTD